MITIPAKRIIQFLCLFVIGLTLANIGVQLHVLIAGSESLESLVRTFDVNSEGNIPTWYSSAALLFCAGLLWLIATIKKQHQGEYVTHWQGLAVIFVLLSIDESASFHELLIPLRETFNTGGFFWFFWVIPAMIFVLAVALVYLKFLAHLPRQIRYLMIASGAIYVFGAVGLEMIGGQYYDLYFLSNGEAFSSPAQAGIMQIILAIEELFEMLGTLLFIYTLLSYASTNLQTAQVF